MQSILSSARRWAAPAAAGVFFVTWCLVDAGRPGPRIGFLPMFWDETLPVLVLTGAIGVAVRWPVLSLALTAMLLAGQLLKIVPPPHTNWAVYLGSFLALGLIAWTCTRRIRIIAFAANTVFAPALTGVVRSEVLGRAHIEPVCCRRHNPKSVKDGGEHRGEGLEQKGHMRGLVQPCAVRFGQK